MMTETVFEVLLEHQKRECVFEMTVCEEEKDGEEREEQKEDRIFYLHFSLPLVFWCAPAPSLFTLISYPLLFLPFSHTIPDDHLLHFLLQVLEEWDEAG